MSEAPKPTFVLFPPTWHNDWCYEEVSRELRGRGYGCETPRLNLGDPRLSLNDHAKYGAEFIVKNLEGKEVIPVGVSRSANIILLIAGLVAVKKLVFINGSFQPEAFDMESFPGWVPEKYGEGFLDEVQETGDRRTMITPSAAKEYMYNRAPEDRAEKAVEQLEAQRLAVYNEPPGSLPEDVPKVSLVGLQDRVVNPLHQIIVAEGYLGVKEVKLVDNWDHVPQVSAPGSVAGELSQQA